MRFQVPQFIEIEDKIFGPLTLKQFIYLAGGAGLSYVLYVVLPLFIAVIPIALVVALALALSFYKVNNKPFIWVLEAAARYAVSNKLYIWRKENRKITPTVQKKDQGDLANQPGGVFIPRLSDSKLKDLTWSLDINETTTPGAQEMYKNNQKSRL